MKPMFSSRSQAVTFNIRDRARRSFSRLNLHYGGVGLLILVNLYLMAQMAYAWQQAKSQGADALAAQQVQLKTAEIAARPLQGLDVKLSAASGNADRFYRDRLPVSYSEVLAELGVLAKKQGVRLARVIYKEDPVAGEGRSGEAAGQLTQISMDATLSGDYRPLVLFVNGLERDKVFFLITGVTLTGQQSGTVNLRVRLVTYRRGLAAAETMNAAESSPITDAEDAASAKANARGAR